ncbi:hypothetical protein DICPUDRAFT_153687 [Dictyostelium purpureum]|uniref:C2 domain-containing protein n=1 Tax=Dictyostelium purpureum TaxID=5786 RepID=F0ZPI5_DICPU|nr:uncharacterized protein DICPUDRAFT_153687 [Dictyostelium purpureum]EGC34138.1 hypothetical protein DICPUDRAFT_153687 [Dictyostelium purpureum]|eukprot:XP_003289336.1 hypothetical protein DICPUDRAFT_153687 [Dictyostelium purpureum]
MQNNSPNLNKVDSPPPQQPGQYPPQQPGQYPPQQPGQYPPQQPGQYPPQQPGQYPPQQPGQYPPQQYQQYPPQQPGQYPPQQYPPQQYPPQPYPPQQYQQYPPQPAFGAPLVTSPTSSNVALINPSLNSQIVNGKITSPGSTFYTTGTNKGTFKLRIICANKLVSADANGKSDPYVKVKSHCIESFKATQVIDKNLNPVWESTHTLTMDDVTKDLLILDVYDHDLIGNDDLLGFVAIDLSLLPLNVEVITTENLSFAKHGTIQIGITCLDFGLTNISPNYIPQYISWRLSLEGREKKEFKKLKKSKETGAYLNKKVHSDYKLVNGFVKRKKNKRDKTKSVLGKGAKSIGSFILDVATSDD